jgi:hypothetical integral membrane protein (TIGR02206 family)
MENWFNRGENGFAVFGWEHLLSLSLIFLTVIIIFISRSRLKESHLIKKVLITGLVLSEITYQYWAIYNEMWDVRVYLPLQLCSLNILLSVVLLLTDNKKLFAFVYLFGFTGALQALITPELFQQAWHFRFIQYFFAHALIVWTAMYYAIVKNYRISWHRFFFSFIWLNVYAAGVYLINILVGANYMFLIKKPSNASLMDVMGPYPWYLIVLELVAFCLCLLVFLPVREKKGKSTHKELTHFNV